MSGETNSPADFRKCFPAAGLQDSARRADHRVGEMNRRKSVNAGSAGRGTDLPGRQTIARAYPNKNPAFWVPRDTRIFLYPAMPGA
jgi:hypothetical protein